MPTATPSITGITAIAIMLIIALILAVIFIGVSVFLGPKRPTAAKKMPYESGMTPVGVTKGQFSVHYYLVAMLFIVFDIETIFLYPWAILMTPSVKLARERHVAPITGDAGFLLAEMAVFMVILFVGYIYLVKKGALEWE